MPSDYTVGISAGELGAIFQRSMEAGMASKGRKKQRELEDRELKRREMESEAERKRSEALAASIAAETEAKKQELARYAEADSAMSQFGKVVQSIDWSSPNARREYEQAIRLHLPAIQKHEGVLRKWEAVHSANMQNQAFVDAKVLDLQVADMQRAVLDNRLGPEGAAITAEARAGKITQSEALSRLTALMDKRRQEVFVQEEKLARLRYGRRSSSPPDFDKLATPEQKRMMGELEATIKADRERLGIIAPPGRTPKADKAAEVSVLTDRIRRNRERYAAISDEIVKRAGEFGSADDDGSSGGVSGVTDASRTGAPSAPQAPSAPGRRRRFNPETGGLE